MEFPTVRVSSFFYKLIYDNLVQNLYRPSQRLYTKRKKLMQNESHYQWTNKIQ